MRCTVDIDTSISTIVNQSSYYSVYKRAEIKHSLYKLMDYVTCIGQAGWVLVVEVV